MNRYRIETYDCLIYLDAKSVSDAIDCLVKKFGDSFVSSIILIKII